MRVHASIFLECTHVRVILGDLFIFGYAKGDLYHAEICGHAFARDDFLYFRLLLGSLFVRGSA